MKKSKQHKYSYLKASARLIGGGYIQTQAAKSLGAQVFLYNKALKRGSPVPHVNMPANFEARLPLKRSLRLLHGAGMLATAGIFAYGLAMQFKGAKHIIHNLLSRTEKNKRISEGLRKSQKNKNKRRR